MERDYYEHLTSKLHNRSNMATQTPPERYKQASEMGKSFLRLLAIKDEDLERECRLVMEDNGYIHDAYLFNACKYLWRLGDKDAVELEVKKALDYLRWFDGAKYIKSADTVRHFNPVIAIAALEGLQAYLATQPRK